ncbi:purine-binding chemotaxis protein CheW [Rheinheimera pacifica]|uniref:chemotaxis protein CheW n=1 Tax=Rheinheimera pacifica TaxID=173990 RepID=UPI000CADB78C|nr:chemotaxis protein CheW [Rheinheimera pacifica]MDR6983539.1 purine-binding chemotaxis protein CheW [Rheinheimera pacifica]PKM19635.1 MAG: chemotaxis protein CheW [Gammaproteobacteria bacterium HGW-Gammaproteobacteria-15]
MFNTDTTVLDTLQARARKLAVVETPVADEPTLELFYFELAQETYAVEARYVVEVLPLRQLTSLPNTPDFVLGIVGVRGHIVSVIDLRCFFDLPQQGLSDLNRIAILRDGRMEFALLTDRTVGTYSLPRQALQASQPHLNGIRREYLLGISDASWAVLDAGKLLSDSRLQVENHA